MIRFIPLLLLIFGACANIVPPSGGPIDQIPPKLIFSSPSNFQRSFEENKIVLQFDELVHVSNGEKIQLFPGNINPTKTISKGKSIIIEFDTIPKGTSILSWNSAIKDVNNDNISNIKSLVFSTNNILDADSFTVSFQDVLNRKQTGPYRAFFSDDLGLVYRQFEVNQSDTFKINNLPYKDKWIVTLGLPNKKDSIIDKFFLSKQYNQVLVGMPLGVEKPFGFDSLRINEILLNGIQTGDVLFEVRDQLWYSVKMVNGQYFICPGPTMLVLISKNKSPQFYSLDDNKKINQINWNEFSSTPSTKRK